MLPGLARETDLCCINIIIMLCHGRHSRAKKGHFVYVLANTTGSLASSLLPLFAGLWETPLLPAGLWGRTMGHYQKQQMPFFFVSLHGHRATLNSTPQVGDVWRPRGFQVQQPVKARESRTVGPVAFWAWLWSFPSAIPLSQRGEGGGNSE